MHKAVAATVVACTLLAGGVVGRAQTAPSFERITLDEAVRRAIEKNYSVAQAAQAILRAEAILQQASTVFRPSVDGAVTTTILDSGRSFDGQVVQPQTQTLFATSASYPVLAASRWAARTQAQDRVGIARIGADETRRQIAIATAQAYLEIIAQQRQVEVRLRAVETARALLDYARARLEGGVGSKLNELRSSQELSTAEVLLEVARLDVRRAQEALGVLLVADAPIDAAAEPTFEVPIVPSGEDWLGQRTDIQLFSAEIRAADRIVQDSWKDWVPNVTAALDPQYLTPAGLFQPSRTWRAVAQSSIPIFDGGERRAVRRQREVSLNTARLQLDALQLRARAELRTAQASLESTERALTNARIAAQSAAEVVRITDVAFKAGATTNIEVVDAQRSTVMTVLAV
ncbi:MAG: TolC family protein [Acidobacteria bacterium]|nr:TolC family protein [Acidobacteriota bacterium]